MPADKHPLDNLPEAEYLRENELDQELRERNEEQVRRWNRAIDAFTILSETSNIGIVIQIVGKWIPQVLTVFGGIFAKIAPWSDLLIYFFKSLTEVTRLVASAYYGVNLEEESHPNRIAAGIASLLFFSLAIPLFAGLIIPPPVGITVAWILALSGLSIRGHFDYAFQEKSAKAKYEKLMEEDASPLEIAKAEKEYATKKTAKKLFFALLLGLTVLLVCGSAAAFAPPLVAPALTLASKLASAFLSMIAVARFYNWWTANHETNVKPESTVEMMPLSYSRDRGEEPAQEVKNQPTVILGPPAHSSHFFGNSARLAEMAKIKLDSRSNNEVRFARS